MSLAYVVDLIDNRVSVKMWILKKDMHLGMLFTKVKREKSKSASVTEIHDLLKSAELGVELHPKMFTNRQILK